MVAAELARLQERERFLERELRSAQRSTSPSAIALDEELVTKMLGEEAARILHMAREAASQIKIRAEEQAGRLLRDTNDEVQRLREEADLEAARRRHDADADAEAELEMAKQQGREMVNEAQAYRERVLGELARRRELARQQIEQLVHGRDRLLQAFERARSVSMEVVSELVPLGEPEEYVNLAVTTGPVPLMVRNERPLGSGQAAAVGAPAEDDITMAHPAPVLDGVDADEDARPEMGSDDGSDADVQPARVGEMVGSGGSTDSGDAEVVELFARRPSGRGLNVVVDESGPDDAGEADDVADVAEPVPVEPVPVEPVPVEPVPVEVERVPSVGDEGGSTRSAVASDAEPLVDSTSEGAAPAGAHAERAAAVAAGEPVDGGDGQAGPGESAAGVAAGPDMAPTAPTPRPSPDDLFARLRASRADTVAQRARRSAAAAQVAGDAPAEGHSSAGTRGQEPARADSVFAATATGPAVVPTSADSPFARRDELLTPLIVASARKLKRALADEQNEALHALRAKDAVTSVDRLVGDASTQSRRYSEAIEAELVAAAAGGAASVGGTLDGAGQASASRDAVRAATELLETEIVAPLRERLARAVADADRDNAELGGLVRVVYREWKTQRIDENLDDVARTAFGHGALAGVAPGTSLCWIVDPNGPECPDAEDNSLAGAVAAGDPFPTDHLCAPAHSGCRCMVVNATPD